jgi:hypothetical protein
MAGDRSGLVTGAVVPDPYASIRCVGLPAGITHHTLFSVPSRRWLRCGKGGMLPLAARVAIGPIARLHRPLARRRGIGSPSRLSQLTALSELVQPAQSSRPVPTSGFGVVP